MVLLIKQGYRLKGTERVTGEQHEQGSESLHCAKTPDCILRT